MAKIYYRRLLAGAITVDEVPARWRAEVEALLAAAGLPETPEGNT
jgi:hypothetical protein